MKIIGNNDGDLGKKSKRQARKDKEARAAATGVRTETITGHQAKVNSGKFSTNSHGLPDGGHKTSKAQPTQSAGEGGAKFRKARTTKRVL